MVAVAAILMVALLAVMWIRGGTQPMQWIEQPVGESLDVSVAQ